MTSDIQPGRREGIRGLRRLAERAVALYDIEPVSLSLLGNAFNTTYTVIAPDGERYVLHILRPEDEPISVTQSRARVESELWWLDRLTVDLALPVPSVVHTRHGEGVVAVDVDGVDAPRVCTLFRWIDGRFLYRQLTPRHLAQVGRLTGELHKHSETLVVPEWFDRPRVDPADEETEERVVGLFADRLSAEGASVMQNVLRQVRRTQCELGGGSDAFGLIHADIHQKNYMFNAGRVRLIDFGDCGWGHYLYDLGVTIHQLGDLPRIDVLGSAVLAGYRQVRDLSLEQEAAIDSFIMLREVQDLSWFLVERDNPKYRKWTSRIGQRLAALDAFASARSSP